ncbi:hypothetical protein BKA56DRAFT_308569 [Ilyonectria sp. MPI-CAGE-AT-0026]|nr:hypothetical protein BKA56DRAFT_308569 [Ilyonectria sp. MPI-CAGE-AT-0026]
MLREVVENRLEFEVSIGQKKTKRTISVTRTSKHMVRHTRPRPCKAGAGCDYGAASKKDLNRHYWSHHKVWAEENSIPDERCKCDACHTSFARQDHKTRHLRKFPECRDKLGLPTE